jgi:hypothetical protein
MSLDGASTKQKEKTFKCPPLTRKVIATFKRTTGDPSHEVWFARVQGDYTAIWPVYLRTTDVRQMHLTTPELKVRVVRAKRAEQGRWRVRIGTDVFAHAVHLVLPEGAVPDDNYFDLLPGSWRDFYVKYDGELTAEAQSVVPRRE